MPADARDRLHDQLRVWRDELIDLTRRNRLLNLSARGAVIEIVSPDLDEVLNGIGAGWRFHYPPLDETEEGDQAVTAALEAEDPDLSDEVEPDELLTSVATARDLSNRLRTMERRARSEWTDRGVRVLYLAVGVLHWADAAEQEMEAPILLVPVKLERPSPRDPYWVSLADDEDWVVNPALAVKLDLEFGIELPDLDDETPIREFLAAVAAAVSSQSDWRVTDRLLLSTFSFQKDAMYRDLRDNAERIVEHALIQAVALGEELVDGVPFAPIPSERLDEAAPPEQLTSILDADSTQRACIVAARDGHSFVMDGPPGTGKSQTIANVIAELLAGGKSVLFVSEKAAALDVVYERLEQSGLDHFVLSLHSAKATRKEVAKELGAALELRPRAEAALADEDLTLIRRLREELNAYASAVNEVRAPLGRSLSWAIGRRAELEDLQVAPVDGGVAPDLTAEALGSVLAAGQLLARSWGPVARGDNFLWRDLGDPAGSQARVGVLEAELRHLVDLHDQLSGAADRLYSELGVQPRDDEAGHAWLANLVQLIGAPPAGVQFPWVTAADFGAIDQRRSDQSALCADLAAREAQLDASGARWRQLSPGVGASMEEAVRQLASLEPPLSVDPRSASPHLHALAGRMRAVQEATVDVVNGALEIASVFGAGARTDIAFARDMAELASLAGLEHRPEASWFDPQALSNVREAAQLLRPLIDQYREMGQRVRSTFTDDVFGLDLERFFEDDQSLEPKLSRFTSDGRRNRRTLKACITSGKIDDSTPAALLEARRCQRLGREIAHVQSQRVGAGNDHYFRHASTDFDALDEALGAAERALVLAAGVDSVALAERLSRQSIDAVQLRSQGEHVRRRLQEIETAAVDQSELTAMLQSGSLPDLQEWSTQAATALAELGRGLDEVSTSAPHAATIGSAEALTRAVSHVRSLTAQLDSADAENREVLGSDYKGRGTDWSGIAAALEWVAELRALFGGPLLEQQARALDNIDPTLWPISAMLQERSMGFDRLCREFRGDHAVALRHELAGPADDVAELLDQLLERRGDIDEWADYCRASDQLERAGLGSTVAFCVDRRVSAAAVPGVIERGVLSAWIDHHLATDARCRPLRSNERDDLVAEFRTLDRRLARHAAARVINACSARRPNTAVGEAGIIRTEAQRKTRHRPIRTLMGDAASVIRAIKPCFMMSPLSVSQYLGPDFTFDVVIFDEASQVRPSDAVNCIYRGSQLIVAGDERQLPPTSFFEAGGGADQDEFDEDAPEDFESVLSLCRRSASLQALPLRWHYRSRHESLITFSNRRFYGGELVTYPGAIEDSPDLGVEFVHVPDGVYQRGGARDNPIEARRVVERVMHHVEHHPERTLGVVAFSEAQATRIERELEFARRDRPDLDELFGEDRLDGFFVKNLENVQGDERDTIIFSIGYGKDENGRFLLNLGPLNKPGGERRLNVAITRARRRVEVVSSIVAADIGDSSNAPGVQSLKAYLRYAEFGPDAPNLPEDGDGEVESPFEAEVRRVIESWGYGVRSQVGHAGYRLDLGVLHPDLPGSFVLGVECDGAAYHSSRVARDRDRLRQEVLEGLGWRMYRVWGPAWYRDRANEELRLRDAIDRAVRGEGRPGRGVGGEDDGPVVTVDEHDLDAPPDWVVPYVQHQSQRRFARGITDPQSRADLTGLVLDIIGTEQPITDSLLVSRVCELWGERRSPRNRNAVANVVEQIVVERGASRPEPGVLATAASTGLVRGPAADGSVRRVDDVPGIEVRAAVVQTVADSGAVDVRELAVRVARLFGWKRAGARIDSTIQRAITEAADAGELRVDSSGVARRP